VLSEGGVRPEEEVRVGCCCGTTGTLAQKVYPADHLDRDFLGHWIHSLAAPAEETLFDHRGGKGSGEPEMAALALPACG